MWNNTNIKAICDFFQFLFFLPLNNPIIRMNTTPDTHVHLSAAILFVYWLRQVSLSSVSIAQSGLVEGYSMCPDRGAKGDQYDQLLCTRFFFWFWKHGSNITNLEYRNTIPEYSQEMQGMQCKWIYGHFTPAQIMTHPRTYPQTPFIPKPSYECLPEYLPYRASTRASILLLVLVSVFLFPKQWDNKNNKNIYNCTYNLPCMHHMA